MIDLNEMVNQEIMREKLRARSELAREIIKILKRPESPSEYMEKIYEVQQRLIEVRDEYLKFQSGIPFEQTKERIESGIPKSFGEKLLELLQLKGLSQKDFANMVGMTEVSISRYINGKRVPKATDASKMASALDTTTDYLISESEEN